MYKKILSYRPSFKPSLVFLIIPVLIIFIFISKSFDQYSGAISANEAKIVRMIKAIRGSGEKRTV